MNRRTFLAGAASSGLALSAAQTRAQGGSRFYVPAEDVRHDRTFMQWPVNRRVYRDPVFLDMVQQTIADIANAIVDFEPVTLLAAADRHRAVRRKVSAAVTLWDVPTDDLWCRDSGPIFVVDDAGGLAVSHIQFNGWGGKQPHRRDARIAETVAARLGLPVLPSGLRGEAGGVEQDGHGVLIAHESSWAPSNRNPGLSLHEIEGRLLAAYGADQIIWSAGVQGQDITDYHIDSLARFIEPGRVLATPPARHNPADPFHNAALETLSILREAGMRLELVPEPTRPRVSSADFIASYANYYVCNGAVVAPEFGDAAADAHAYDTLQACFPDREIITLNVDPLGELGGGIHCATQQAPSP